MRAGVAAERLAVSVESSFGASPSLARLQAHLVTSCGHREGRTGVPTWPYGPVRRDQSMTNEAENRGSQGLKRVFRRLLQTFPREPDRLVDLRFCVERLIGIEPAWPARKVAARASCGRRLVTGIDLVGVSSRRRVPLGGRRPGPAGPLEVARLPTRDRRGGWTGRVVPQSFLSRVNRGPPWPAAANGEHAGQRGHSASANGDQHLRIRPRRTGRLVRRTSLSCRFMVRGGAQSARSPQIRA